LIFLRVNRLSLAARSSCYISGATSWEQGAVSKSKSRLTLRLTGCAASSLTTGATCSGGCIAIEEFSICDQYTIQGDILSRAVRGDGDVPVSLEDTIKNMALIDAIFRSGDSGKWEIPKAE
jgi:hypothetical protein